MCKNRIKMHQIKSGINLTVLPSNVLKSERVEQPQMWVCCVQKIETGLFKAVRHSIRGWSGWNGIFILFFLQGGATYGSWGTGPTPVDVATDAPDCLLYFVFCVCVCVYDDTVEGLACPVTFSELVNYCKAMKIPKSMLYLWNVTTASFCSDRWNLIMLIESFKKKLYRPTQNGGIYLTNNTILK